MRVSMGILTDKPGKAVRIFKKKAKKTFGRCSFFAIKAMENGENLYIVEALLIRKERMAKHARI